MLAAVLSVPLLAVHISIVKGMFDEDVRYEEREEDPRNMRVRTIGGDRSKQKPNLKIISGLAEINRANIVRVCKREEERERVRGEGEREREREKERERKKERDQAQTK